MSPGAAKPKVAEIAVALVVVMILGSYAEFYDNCIAKPEEEEDDEEEEGFEAQEYN